MNKTPNYQLNQWEATDKVQRVDFNADNAKIDAALGSLTSGKGNCRVAAGSYTGTGTFGANSPNRLTFPFKPLMVAISCEQDPCVLVAGTKTYLQSIWMYSATWELTWSGNSVSWYVSSASYHSGGTYQIDDATQFNERGKTYRYVVIGAADG